MLVQGAPPGGPACRTSHRRVAPADGGWQVAPELHARVRYSSANLLEPADTLFLATAPFVFCRNVFIYFSTATIARVVGHFADRMPRPGYLFVGVSESLLRFATGLSCEETDGTFVYRKVS